jgi:hypothetical protein
MTFPQGRSQLTGTTWSFRVRSDWSPWQIPATVLFDGGGQPELHAAPAGQHLRLAPLPQGVVLGGHPQMPLARSRQATPDAQQAVPQGVDPFGQQQPPPGSEHVSPALQQKLPQVCPPAGHPQAPVEALRHTLLCGQHTDPQTLPVGQHAPPTQV